MSNLPIKRKATQLDKIRAFLIADRKSLGKRDMIKCQRMQEANNKLVIGYSKEQAAGFLQNQFGIGRSEAYRLIRETIQVFGDITESNKKGLRHIMYENFMLLANIARQRQDLLNWNRALENASKVLGVFEHGDSFDPGSLQLPTMLILTSDPSVLQEPPQNASYVEIP